MTQADDEQKLERIRYLLDRWEDIFDVSAASNGTGSGEKLVLLPRMANHPSVKELDRCLSLLRSSRPGDYRHLQSYRMGAEWRTVDTWARVKLPSGRFDWVTRRVRERIEPRWLSQSRVLAAERFLLRVFKGEVFIPDELWSSFAPAA